MNSFSTSLAIQFEPAAAQIKAIGGLGGTGAPEHLGIEAIDHVFAVFAMPDEASMTQNTEVVRDVCQWLLKQGRQLADSSRSGPQAGHDAQPLRVSECLEEAGADFRVKWVVHDQ